MIGILLLQIGNTITIALCRHEKFNPLHKHGWNIYSFSLVKVFVYYLFRWCGIMYKNQAMPKRLNSVKKVWQGDGLAAHYKDKIGP